MHPFADINWHSAKLVTCTGTFSPPVLPALIHTYGWVFQPDCRAHGQHSRCFGSPVINRNTQLPLQCPAQTCGHFHPVSSHLTTNWPVQLNNSDHTRTYISTHYALCTWSNISEWKYVKNLKEQASTRKMSLKVSYADSTQTNSLWNPSIFICNCSGQPVWQRKDIKQSHKWLGRRTRRCLEQNLLMMLNWEKLLILWG